MTTPALFDLTGKVALVTGGNSGLGLGFASGMAKCGADLVIWGRRADKNDEAAELLRSLGARNVVTDTVDVADESAVVDGFAKAVDEFGRIDGVVANAGTADIVEFHDLTTERYDRLLAVNQHGAFFTLREAVRHMRSRAELGDPGGSLIMCGSLSNFLGVARMEHYAAAKGAVAGIIRGIAVEYGALGIRANIVAAGAFYTGLMGGIPEAQIPLTEVLRARNPIPRWGYPADIEGISVYLMSDASSFHTGDMIVIDGGQSLLVLGS